MPKLIIKKTISDAQLKNELIKQFESMSSVFPNFDAAARKNQAYLRDYGQDKSVFSPVWAGAEGDQVALQRSSYPSASAYQYFNGPIYNQQYRMLLTTGLQGRAKSVTDRHSMTGMSDYSTYGRDVMEYEELSTDSPNHMDMLIGMVVLGAALGFLMFYN